MICGHYQNEPIGNLSKINPSELETYLTTRVIEKRNLSEINFNQIIDIDITSFLLSYGCNCHPIAISNENTHLGNYVVVEKWEYPYWKENGLVYVPSEENPIGKHLIILAERKSLRKVSTSIHSWPLPPHAQKDFIKGNNSKGCVRLNKEEMGIFFDNVELGAGVYIHR